MTPLMYSSAPGVVKRRSRYARRFSSIDSTPIVSKRFLIVPLDSSAARIPFPSATSARAVSCSSLFDMNLPFLAVSDSIMARRCRRLYIGPVAVVRYLVDDVDASVGFYTRQLGFALE